MSGSVVLRVSPGQRKTWSAVLRAALDWKAATIGWCFSENGRHSAPNRQQSATNGRHFPPNGRQTAANRRHFSENCRHFWLGLQGNSQDGEPVSRVRGGVSQIRKPASRRRRTGSQDDWPLH